MATKSKAGSKTKSTTASARAKSAKTRRWSARVTAHSDAMDLEHDVFKKGSAHDVALSLKRSAERSHRRKSAPFRSALSMLTFYINRAGKNLPASRVRTLNKAKDELRKLFGRQPNGSAHHAARHHPA